MFISPPPPPSGPRALFKTYLTKQMFSLPAPQLDNEDVDLVSVLDSTDKSSLDRSQDSSTGDLFFIGEYSFQLFDHIIQQVIFKF